MDRNAPLTTHHPHNQSHYFSHYQLEHRPEHHNIRLNFQPSLDSEYDFRSGCRNVSHYQQSFSGLLKSFTHTIKFHGGNNDNNNNVIIT